MRRCAVALGSPQTTTLRVLPQRRLIAGSGSSTLAMTTVREAEAPPAPAAAPADAPAGGAVAAAAAAANVGGQQQRCVPPLRGAALDAHVERAWAHFRSLGSPKWHVAPMVDQSELPFRMLCRAHGAQAAYTPMLHARLFLQQPSYRQEHFTTCEADRPLFVQFCANDPDTFVGAARLVQASCDYVDLNLGCPQRIAKRGAYGAFLMDDLPRVAALVSAAAAALDTPVSVKVRLFPRLDDTLAYVRLLQECGASLLAVHGRTRDVKDNAAHRADWASIAAVRAALRIPVLANGDVRCLADAHALMEATGADGVMSAEPLLLNPALFSPQRPLDAIGLAPRESVALCRQYVELLGQHPTHMRMIRGHMFKLLHGWLCEFTHLRERLNRQAYTGGVPLLQQLLCELEGLIEATGRDHPVPVLSERKLKQQEREAAKQAAIAEQEREAAALAALDSGEPAAEDAAPCLQQQAPHNGRAPGAAAPSGSCTSRSAAPDEGPARKKQQVLSVSGAVP